MHKVGQRWFSEAEPELGLGIVESTEQKFVDIFFPAANENRRYGIKTAPLKRVSYLPGDQIQSEEGKEYIVEEVKENEGVLFYFCKQAVIPESQLKSALSFTRPQDKLFAGNVDSISLFNLRYESTLALRKYQQFKHKGLLGSKVSLIPHQMYVVSELSQRPICRAMLADEVGLGKTIEACLILKSLLMQNKIQRALIVVPDALVYQWFIELYKKFNLRFHTISDSNEVEVEAQDFDQGPHYIIGLKKLMSNENLQNDLLSHDWDLLILDEAHQIKWEENNPSQEYLLLKSLSEKISNLLLLTATPQILGKAGHFARLHLLDSDKFKDYHEFLKQEENYKKLIPVVKKIQKGNHTHEDLKLFFGDEEINHFKSSEEILSALVDRHGTGRVYFRNTRENMEKNHEFFPKRICHPIPIQIEGLIEDKYVYAHKVTYLKELLDKNPDQKVLVITHSKDLVLKIQRSLHKITTVNVGVFHSDQTIMERDRQAAWFAEPNGARVLLCTEIGSEGRNFEFAHHLYLFDIPKVPEQLEQRIGRLDRIGQTSNINIHVPYIKSTFEELLFHWYSEVIHSFKEAPKGAGILYQEFKEELKRLIESKYDSKEVFNFLELATKRYKEIKKVLANGHDILLDLNSFNHNKAQSILSEINANENSNELKDYIKSVFDVIGVHNEELNNNVDFYSPTETMLMPVYPGLNSEGVSVSFNRDFSLKRDDIEFMSWEHPIAQGTMELFVTTELGNMCVASHQGKLPLQIGLEFFFKLDVHDALGSDSYHYLPVTPVRVLVGPTGEDLTSKVPKNKVDLSVIESSKEMKEQLSSLPKDQFKSLLEKAKNIAFKRAQKYKQDAIEKLEHDTNLNLDRVNNLIKVNKLIDKNSIKQIIDKKEYIDLKIQNSTIDIDAIRIIVS